MSCLIFLNGMPRSGKDTVGSIIVDVFGGECVKMTEPIDKAFVSLFGLQDWQFQLLREKFKETPMPVGDIDHGVSLRDFYIRFSEDFLKPLLGPGIFGNLASARISQLLSEGNVVVTDCGFNDEVRGVLDEVSPSACWGLEIRRDGTSWDSRERIDWDSHGIEYTAIGNNGSFEDLQDLVMEVCQDGFNLLPCERWMRRELSGDLDE